MPVLMPAGLHIYHRQPQLSNTAIEERETMPAGQGSQATAATLPSVLQEPAPVSSHQSTNGNHATFGICSRSPDLQSSIHRGEIAPGTAQGSRRGTASAPAAPASSRGTRPAAPGSCAAALALCAQFFATGTAALRPSPGSTPATTEQEGATGVLGGLCRAAGGCTSRARHCVCLRAP